MAIDLKATGAKVPCDVKTIVLKAEILCHTDSVILQKPSAPHLTRRSDSASLSSSHLFGATSEHIDQVPLHLGSPIASQKNA